MAANIQVTSYGTYLNVDVTITDYPNAGDSWSKSFSNHLDLLSANGRFIFYDEHGVVLYNWSDAECADITVNGTPVADSDAMKSAILAAVL